MAKRGNKGGSVTQAVMEERINIVMAALADGLSQADIFRIAKKKQWGISERQVQNYMIKASKVIRDDLKDEREQILAVAIRRYTRIFNKALANDNLREANNAVTNQLKALGLLDSNTFIQQNNQFNYGSSNELSENESITKLIEEFAERSIEACNIESDVIDAISNKK